LNRKGAKRAKKSKAEKEDQARNPIERTGALFEVFLAVDFFAGSAPLRFDQGFDLGFRFSRRLGGSIRAAGIPASSRAWGPLFRGLRYAGSSNRVRQHGCRENAFHNPGCPR
jgi:hypothetical protein